MSQAQLDPGLPWDKTLSVTDTFGSNTACDQCIQHLDSGLAGGDQLLACASFQPESEKGQTPATVEVGFGD